MIISVCLLVKDNKERTQGIQNFIVSITYIDSVGTLLNEIKLHPVFIQFESTKLQSLSNLLNFLKAKQEEINLAKSNIHQSETYPGNH